MNTSFPISTEFTLDFIRSEASFSDSPATTTFPMSGIVTDPSEFTKSSSIYSFGPTNWISRISPTSSIYPESGLGSLIGINVVWKVLKKSKP